MQALVTHATHAESPVTVPPSRSRHRLGIGISAAPVAFLLFDVAIKLVKIPPVVESFERLGYSPDVARGIGTLEAACLLLYLVPRTSVLGAVALTGFLGGAIATHVRVGDPLFSHVLFPVYVAALLWMGLALRDRRLAVFSPFTGARGR